eukprot:g65544.t1
MRLRVKMEAEQIVRAHREAERRKTDAEGVRQAHLDQIKFQVGDIVLLYHPQVPKGVSSKLFTHWKGPYQIMEQTGPLNYKIRELHLEWKSEGVAFGWTWSLRVRLVFGLVFFDVLGCGFGSARGQRLGKELMKLLFRDSRAGAQIAFEARPNAAGAVVRDANICVVKWPGCAKSCDNKSVTAVTYLQVCSGSQSYQNVPYLQITLTLAEGLRK